MILIIDNYDSFTFNLVQALGTIGLRQPSLSHEIRVIRHDETTIAELVDLGATHLLISPGPCTPKESGISRAAIEAFTGKIPILGVCLGHQCIADVFGANVRQADRIMHGKTSEILHNGTTIFADVPNPFTAMRYHSLIVDGDTLSDSFEVTAWTRQGECMGLRHRDMPLAGVQFHPESFMTDAGTILLSNFLRT